MPYRLYNGKSNVVSEIISKNRLKNNLSYSQLSDKLQLLGITLYKNDLFLIENNRRLVRDFELLGLCLVLNIDFNELIKNIDLN